MKTTYHRAYVKLSELHFNVLMFFYCIEKALKIRGKRDRFIPQLSLLFRTFFPQLKENNTLKFSFYPIKSDIYHYYVKLLELNFNVSLFSNCGEKIPNSIKTFTRFYIYKLTVTEKCHNYKKTNSSKKLGSISSLFSVNQIPTEYSKLVQKISKSHLLHSLHSVLNNNKKPYVFSSSGFSQLNNLFPETPSS